MKKMIVIVLVLFVVFSCYSAYAHTKSFDEYQTDLDKVMSDLAEANKIRQACQDCIDAFNAGEKAKQDEAYKIITESGLMPEHYTIKDTSLIEPILLLYEKYCEAYNNDMTAIMKHQAFWYANSITISDLLTQAQNNEIILFPAPNTKHYANQLIYGLQNDFFDPEKNLEEYYSNIYIIKGTLYENDADEGYCFIQYEDEEYGKRIICAMNPREYNSGISYLDLHDMPDEGTEMYFCLTYFIKRDSDNLKIFYLGADDQILDDFRLISIGYDT